MTPSLGPLKQRGLAESVRHLRCHLAKAKNPDAQRRLRVVCLLLEGNLKWPAIQARTQVPRSTAYCFLRQYREQGLERLLHPKGRGRPVAIPQVVRERFAYLCRPDPQTLPTPKQSEPHVILYIIERERAVFRILGARFTVRQIGRWFGQLAREVAVQDQVRKFRKMRSAYEHLRQRWELDLQPPKPKTKAALKHFIRVDALHFESSRRPLDRELCRRWLAAWHKVSLTEVAFSDEPHDMSHYIVWPAPSKEGPPRSSQGGGHGKLRR